MEAHSKNRGSSRRRATGQAPAVALWDPKYAHNVGGALRACSCFGVGQLWWSGDRVTLDIPKGQRLPREERMKGYRDVEMVRDDRIFDAFPPEVTPVAVELRPGAEVLFDFEHPSHPLYVFGPEDGSLPKAVVRHCHRFAIIPTAHCLNLASAVVAVLYDWRLKRRLSGLDGPRPPEAYLAEHRGPIDNADVFEGISASGMGSAHGSRERFH
jgi:tRNA(Leu) C34 or U34 (ribose-2'-O)-methylase TrmL